MERYADQAALGGLGAFGLALPATGNPRRAANLALAAVPKAARLGREVFAAGLGRVLARRGAVVLDAAVLRRLDRVDTVVLDTDVLVTGGLMLGEVVAVAEVDPGELAARLYALFRPDDPAGQRGGDDGWVLGPLAQRAAGSQRAARERDRLVRAGAVHVLGLARGDRLVVVASVIAEPSESVDALAAAGRTASLRRHRCRGLHDPEHLACVQIDEGHPRFVPFPGLGGRVAEEPHGPVAVFIDAEHPRCQASHQAASASRSPRRAGPATTRRRTRRSPPPPFRIRRCPKEKTSVPVTR